MCSSGLVAVKVSCLNLIISDDSESTISKILKSIPLLKMLKLWYNISVLGSILVNEQEVLDFFFQGTDVAVQVCSFEPLEISLNICKNKCGR